MGNTVFKHNLGSRLYKRFAFYGLILVLLAGGVLVLLYNMQVKNDKAEAEAKGESIVASMLTELRRCYDTTVLMNDLYKVKGQAFLDDFELICKEFQADNLAIGSMYWAPEGIIHYSYPEKVTEATLNFQMLKDPVQGPKAQKAVDDKKATIAGPHDLVEGGKGFIIRNPFFNEKGEFEGFAIMVVDTEAFMKEVMKNLDQDAKGYRFAVWKEEDATAVYDDGGYILASNGPIGKREIVIPFYAPNDKWYLTLEPVGGWNHLYRMRYIALGVIAILLALLAVMHMVIHNVKMSEEVEKASKEKARLNELEQHQQELMEARDAAEAANRSKTIFINNMSHDIRTPMNAILGFADLMGKNLDSKEILSDYLGKIKTSGEYLLTIINNVLDMARIESGKSVVDEEFYDFKAPGSNIIPVFEELAKKKNITLTFTEDIQHPHVWLDKTKQQQILMNIISNAIKYTPEGGTIKCSMTEKASEREGYGRYVLVVTDTGIGMSEEFLEHIFDSFSRERNTTDSKILGTGLGMSIVKKLVDLLGGEIEVKSEQGKGSTFIVTIDHRIVDDSQHILENANEHKNGNSFEGRRILLAEDNDLNAEIAIAILEDMGLEVERAVDGVECVKMLSEAEAGHYDLIFMDVQMPNLNGYDATRRIREMENLAKADIAIIAMTANAFEEDRKKAFESGMDGHLAKPVNIEELTSILKKNLK